MMPMANTYVEKEQLNKMEPFYPLHAYVCQNCFLVQLEEFESPGDIFSDYQYFSSYSETLLQHAKEYSEMMIERFGLNEENFVTEIASNDGYLLNNFVEKDIPVLGIDPAKNVAEVARERGVPSLVRFFGKELAKGIRREGKRSDLIIANNVLAHVPDLNGFVEGMKILLKPEGVITVEFPHLQQLLEDNEFDTIYHEHFSYYSFTTAEKIFAHHGLTLFDVDEIPIHGGTLRIYAKHENDSSKNITDDVIKLRAREKDLGYTTLDVYTQFKTKVMETKRDILEFAIRAKREGKQIAGYGAPAKGNTLLNYCGIKTDFIDYTVDISPHKQGYYLPGTHIPIYEPDKIAETKPDYIFILPWNIKEEIMNQLAYVREWECKFVTPIPNVTIYE
jgi:SAM-dependent methyltransferase